VLREAFRIHRHPTGLDVEHADGFGVVRLVAGDQFAVLAAGHPGEAEQFPTRALYDALETGDYAKWHAYKTDQIEESGQHEVLNWFCLLGAMEALGCKPDKAVFLENRAFVSPGGLRALPRPVAGLPAVRRSNHLPVRGGEQVPAAEDLARIELLVAITAACGASWR
jgi:hypothetical protein